MARDRNSGRALLVLLFLAGLVAPALDHLLRPPAARSVAQELRGEAPLPAWGWTLPAIRGFPEALRRHFDDTLGWRDRLLHWNSLQQLEVFGRFPAPTLYTGPDGWWYYAELDALPVWRGLRPFREEELESWRLALERQRDWLSSRASEFLFVLAPNKETIYPEHLPEGYARVGPTRMDQFAEYMRAHSDVAFLDLRPALLAEKAADRGDDLLYYPLGTHWTERGSWIAFREILRALRPRMPCLPQAGLGDYTVRRNESQGDTWAGRLYSPETYVQACYEYKPRDGFHFETLPQEGRSGQTRRQRKGAACASSLMLHDSFGYKVDCFLAECFAKQLQCEQMTLDEALVDESRPAVVIEIFAESKLMLAPPRFVPTQDAQKNRATFESSSRSLFLWDGERGPEGIEGNAGARVEAGPGGRGACIRTERPAQTFLTPPLPPAGAQPSVLQLAIESESAQILDVFYLHPGDATYQRSRCFQIELAAGSNEIYQLLEDRELRGRLSIRPRVPGRLLLQRIELRAVR
jgi:SGNH hydrolase-like domain, acetyltransferase AlgX